MKKFVVAAAVLLFLTPAAWAGAYVGASIGQSEATFAGVDGDDSSWKIVGGYTFMKFVGVEGSYRNLGGASETVGTTSFSTDLSSMDVFGVGTLPLGVVDVFAKLGYSRMKLEGDITDPGLPPLSVSFTENELAYGVGVAFGVSKVTVRVEFEAFDTAESLNMLSAGAIFKF